MGLIHSIVICAVVAAIIAAVLLVIGVALWLLRIVVISICLISTSSSVLLLVMRGRLRGILCEVWSRRRLIVRMRVVGHDDCA